MDLKLVGLAHLGKAVPIIARLPPGLTPCRPTRRPVRALRLWHFPEEVRRRLGRRIRGVPSDPSLALGDFVRLRLDPGDESRVHRAGRIDPDEQHSVLT